MSDTPRLGLPLVQASQAQKHVTVNESLTRLDGLTHLQLKSVSLSTPPTSASEGDVHFVGAGATDAWAGEDGNLALFSNGGWDFVAPQVGWAGWSETVAARVVFDGVDWVSGAGAMTGHRAGFVHRSVETDHTITSGAVSTVAGTIPANAIVYGVTGRVLSDIGGAGSFRVGVAGSDDRYGSGIGVVSGSWLRGLTGTPLTYYGDTDLLLTAEGGSFDGTGEVRLVVHFAELTLPRA